MEDDTLKETNNVVKGPWKRARVVSQEETEKLADDMIFIDDVVEAVMIPIIHNLAENGIDLNDEDFLKEIGFLDEILKSIMHRSLGYSHSMSNLITTLMKIETDNPLQTYAKFDYKLANKFVEDISKDDKI